MRRSLRATALGVACAALAVGPARAQRIINLDARGPGATPIGGAAVVVFNVPQSVFVQGITDGSGHVTLAVPVGLNRVRVTAGGFVPWRDTVSVPTDSVRVIATLDSVTASAPDSLWRDPVDTLLGRSRFLLHLDSLGIVPAAGLATSGRAALRDSLAVRGARYAHDLPGGIEIFGYDDTLLLAGTAARDSAFLRARQLRAALAAFILQAGPIATGAGFGGRARVATDEVVMRFPAGVSQAAISAQVASVSGQIVFWNPYVTNEILTQAVDGDGVALARRAQALPRILRANVNFRVDTRGGSVSLPAYDPVSQWHLDRVAARQAWGAITGDVEVSVAVLEVGPPFDLTHRDLTPRLQPGIAGWDFTGCQSEVAGAVGVSTSNTQPCWSVVVSGYGTHSTGVAGLIAADRNGFGVAGVCPMCRLMLLLEQGSNSHAKELAIEHAAANGARVLNASWESSGEDRHLRAAIESAVRDKAMAVVLAAGDDNQSCDDWEVLDAVGIAVVGAVGRDDRRTPQGVSGPCLSVVAPGRDLKTTAPNNGFERLSGTSAAAPVVTGIAGLVLAARGDLSATGVRDLIVGSAEAVAPDDAQGGGGHNDTYGSGLVNACAAVYLALGRPESHERCAPPARACPWWVFLAVGLAVFLLAFFVWPATRLNGAWRWLVSVALGMAAVLVAWLVCRLLS
jgi:hypothetical protein